MAEQTKTRRSHCQALAHRKYRRMVYVSGDGEWIVLSKCSQPWSYRLFDDLLFAQIAEGTPCGADCRGRQFHKCWRLRDE